MNCVFTYLKNKFYTKIYFPVLKCTGRPSRVVLFSIGGLFALLILSLDPNLDFGFFVKHYILTMLLLRMAQIPPKNFVKMEEKINPWKSKLDPKQQKTANKCESKSCLWYLNKNFTNIIFAYIIMLPISYNFGSFSLGLKLLQWPEPQKLKKMGIKMRP